MIATTSESRKPKLPALHRLIRDMSSEAYHGTQGTWSSSQLKDIIDDEEVFIKKYIRREMAKLEGEALDTGTYLHTGSLEPHKLATEIAVFDGKVRYGKAWEIFKAKNKGKTVITQRQKEQGDGMIKAVQSSPVSMGYLKGTPEISFFVKLVVDGDKIFAPHYGKVLTKEGWEDTDDEGDGGYEMVMKVRADCLGEGFISDLKSTSGKATQASSVRGSISKYKYDLSAALYLDLFNLVKEDVTEFIWIFVSKENPCAKSWRATEKQILVGRAKWSWAVKRLADLAQCGWDIPDSLGHADPLPHEEEWLVEKSSDLL